LKRILLSTVVVSSLVMASEPDLKKDDKLITHTEFGYIETQGNTRTQTFNLETKMKKGWQRHILNFLFDGQYASDKNEEIKRVESILFLFCQPNIHCMPWLYQDYRSLLTTI